MDKYIKELLLLHSKLILPKFGAIVIANEETGELSFNEYLSYDDGKLSNLLEQESNMDLQEAQNSVAKYVRELKLQLNKGETYSIFQLGEFSKDKEGAFVFKGNIKTGEKSEITKTPTDPKIVIPKQVNEPKPPVVQDEQLPETAKEETKKPVGKVEKTAETVRQEKTSEKTNNPEVKKNVYVEKNSGTKSNTTPTKDNQTKAIIVEEKKRKKGFLFWFLLFLVILILSGTAFVLLNQEKVEEYMGWTMFDKKKTNKDAIEIEPQSQEKEEETPVKDENVVEEPIAEQEKAEQENVGSVKIPRNEVTSTSSGQHHIIVGCFGEKSNADKQVESFKGKGYDSKILYKSGGLYFVAAQSYPTYNAANSALSVIKQDADGAWIYKK